MQFLLRPQCFWECGFLHSLCARSWFLVLLHCALQTVGCFPKATKIHCSFLLAWWSAKARTGLTLWTFWTLNLNIWRSTTRLGAFGRKQQHLLSVMPSWVLISLHWRCFVIKRGDVPCIYKDLWWWQWLIFKREKFGKRLSQSSVLKDRSRKLGSPSWSFLCFSSIRGWDSQ